LDAHLSVGHRVRCLRAEAMTMDEVARHVGWSPRTVKGVTAGKGKREDRATPWLRGPGRLPIQEREELSLEFRRGDSFAAIGCQLGRSTSTLSREVAANGGRDDYRAWRPHDRAYHAARRLKPAKLDCPRLAAQVTEWLKAWWSAAEITRRLPIEFTDEPVMRLSHETIYQSTYVQCRGGPRRELARCLRSGRAQRRPSGSRAAGGSPTW